MNEVMQKSVFEEPTDGELDNRVVILAGLLEGVLERSPD